MSTQLAFDRTRLAFDRTMQAWIRTGASLITFGFSVYKFFQLEPHRTNNRLIGPHEFGIVLVITGLFALLLGTVEHQRNIRTLRASYPTMPRSATSLVAVMLSVFGLLVLAAVVLRE
jgi:putative membrane protein